MSHTKSILFITKKRQTSTNPEDWGYTQESGKSSGLANSVNMVAGMLLDMGIKCVVEEAIDNNCIDRLVTLHRPEVVIIEALWVIPEKFEVLHRLHPKVQWVVRLHSEIPFLATEGMAMDWLWQHQAQSEYVTIAANSNRIRETLTKLLGIHIAYLPNYYTCERQYATNGNIDKTINISCFGAIRPLKNHLAQAIAAIQFADNLGCTLRFHINSTRIEGNANSILRNLRGVFTDNSRHELVEHGWYPREEFKQVLRDQIDIGMQVSFTESYNIVAADHIDCGIPVVTSPEVAFVARPYTADPTDIDDMVAALRRSIVLRWMYLQHINSYKLDNTNQRTQSAWLAFARYHHC